MIGNSVTRHWLFVLNDLVNGHGANLGESPDFLAMRQFEKQMCGSSEDVRQQLEVSSLTAGICSCGHDLEIPAVV